MKKAIIFLFLLVGLVFVSQAQMRTDYMAKGSNAINVTTNYTLTDAVAKYWEVIYKPDWYNAQTLVVNLDSASGNHTNVAVALYGRASDQLAWTAIGSAQNWKGTSSDTTLTFTNATEVLYRQVKLLFTGTGTGTTTIDRMEFIFYNGLP